MSVSSRLLVVGGGSRGETSKAHLNIIKLTYHNIQIFSVQHIWSMEQNIIR